METEVMKRIRKLLALANSSNENEAKVAAQKAHELLLKHNLSISEVKTEHIFSEHYVHADTKKSPEDHFVLNIIRTYFFVIPVFRRHHASTTVSFIGTRENAKIAAYVFTFLKSAFKSLYAEYAKHLKEVGLYGLRSKNVSLRKSYYLGLQRGISAKMEEMQVKVENETGLVVADQYNQILKHMQDTFGKLRNSRNDVAQVDRHTVNEGFEAGKNLHIRKALDTESSDNSKKLFLPKS